MTSGEKVTPITDATIRRLDDLWRTFRGSLSNEEGRQLIRHFNVVSSVLRTHCTPTRPVTAKIHVLSSDQLAMDGDCSLMRDACARQPLGRVTIERVVIHAEFEEKVHGERMLTHELDVGRQIGPTGAAALLREASKPGKIPKAWREIKFLLPGVVRLNPHRGTREFAVARWEYGRGWHLVWNEFEREFGREYQTLRLRS